MDPIRPPAAPEARLHFLDYWRIIRIRKAVIILVFLLVTVTDVIVTIFLPKAYSSKATIRVERDATEMTFSGPSPYASMYDPYFIQTELNVIKSATILDRVIETNDLTHAWMTKFKVAAPIPKDDVRGLLKGMITLTPERSTSLLYIGVMDDNAAEAAKLAQSVAESYESYREEQWKHRMSLGITAFQEELEKYENQVSNQQDRVEKMRVDLHVLELDPNSSVPSPTLSPMSVLAYHNKKIESEIEAAKFDQQVSIITNLSALERRNALPTSSPDAILVSLLQEFDTAKSTLVSLQAQLGTNHPDVIKAQSLIATLDQQIDERVKGVVNAMIIQGHAAHAAANAVDALLEKAKTEDLDNIKKTRPFYVAKADLDMLKRFQEAVTIRVDQEKVNARMPTLTFVQIIDPAVKEDRPVRPNKPLCIGLGLALGLIVGVGLAFFIEYLDTSVKTIDDVERTLQAPVLGVIPQNVGYLLEEGAESPHAEAYRVLRTNLLFSRKDEKLNTIAVVSAGAGEGKSTTVCNLATVFAQGGQRVLMVDSDLRRPTLHRLLQAGNSLGLTNYLLKQNTLEEVIQTTKLASLDFMASGKLPSSSLGILSSAQMKDLITELKQRYDFVFFDSPPIMGVSDASILASEVNMTLQVIQYRRYPQPMNIRAKQLIEKVGGNLIGIVLNNINMAQDESYYYYSGYYHDYYSKNEDDGAGANGAAREKSRVDPKSKA